MKSVQGQKADVTPSADEVGFHLKYGHSVRQSKVMEEVGQRPTRQRSAKPAYFRVARCHPIDTTKCNR
jgi:hypothetical protein